MSDTLERTLDQRLRSPMVRAGMAPQAYRLGEAVPTRTFWQDEDTGRWWFIAAPEDDPLIRTRGELDVPPQVAELFRRLANDGFDPDVVRIGHEFPSGVDPRSFVARPSAPMVRPATDVARGAETVGRTLPVILKGAGTLVLGVAVVLGGLMAALSEIDPVVIAGVKLDEDTYAWVEVARWNQ